MTDNARRPEGETAYEQTLGQAIEAALRETTTHKRGFEVGPHEAAFVAAVTAREWLARDLERLASNRNPGDPEGSAAYSRWAMSTADRIRHPERYEGVAANDA